jgi:hypothetical protein
MVFVVLGVAQYIQPDLSAHQYLQQVFLHDMQHHLQQFVDLLPS